MLAACPPTVSIGYESRKKSDPTRCSTYTLYILFPRVSISSPLSHSYTKVSRWPCRTKSSLCSGKSQKTMQSMLKSFWTSSHWTLKIRGIGVMASSGLLCCCWHVWRSQCRFFFQDSSFQSSTSSTCCFHFHFALSRSKEKSCMPLLVPNLPILYMSQCIFCILIRGLDFPVPNHQSYAVAFVSGARYIRRSWFTVYHG